MFPPNDIEALRVPPVRQRVILRGEAVEEPIFTLSEMEEIARVNFNLGLDIGHREKELNHV